jgi:hypothetical protein
MSEKIKDEKTKEDENRKKRSGQEADEDPGTFS